MQIYMETCFMPIMHRTYSKTSLYQTSRDWR